MKTTVRILTLSILTILLLLQAGSVMAQTPPPPGSGQTYQGDRLVIAETLRLQPGDRFNGNLTVIGGQLEVPEAAQVNGDITLMGGILNLGGQVSGDIAAMGASVHLEASAVVDGGITSIGANISGAEDATVRGGVNQGDPESFRIGNIPFNFDFGERGNQPDNNYRYNYTPEPFDLLGRLIRDFFVILAVAVLALLAVAVAPVQSRNVTDTLAAQPAQSAGIGLLTLVLLPFIVVLLALLMITIILIPVTLLAYMAIGLVLLLAWIASGYQIGRILERSFRQDWAEPVVAGIGALVLGTANFLVGWIPCIGWLGGVIAVSFGLGALILSRLGTNAAPPRPSATAIVPTPPSPPPAAPPAPPPPAWPVVEPTPDDTASAGAVSTPPDEPKI